MTAVPHGIDIVNVELVRGALDGEITHTTPFPQIISIPCEGSTAGFFEIVLPYVVGKVASVHLKFDATTPPAGGVIDITLTNETTERVETTTNVADGVVFIPESAAGKDDFWIHGPMRLLLADMGVSKKLQVNITVLGS